jgi:DNA polymerase III alpha subunit (gram-positive type)
VGYRVEGGLNLVQRFKPELPVKIGAMAVNHITNKMLEDCDKFSTSEMAQDLTDLARSGHVLVAHNAPFDLSMLAREGVVFENFIDTKKLSHKIDAFETMESHRLQYLRYYYDIELPLAEAHTAEGDIAVLEAVYYELVKRLGEPSIEEQIAISKKPVLYGKFKFGKYNGNSIADIASVDPKYLEWLLAQKESNGQNEEDWIYTLKHFLNHR